MRVMDKDIRENKVLVLVSSVLILLVIFAGAVYASLDTDVVERSYFANGTIIAEEMENLTAGIDAGRNLHYGRFGEGTNVTKSLEFSSSNKALANLDSEGNISRKLVYEEYSLFAGNHSVDVMMQGKHPGYYEGDVNIEIVVSNNRVTDEWLKLRNWLHSQ